MCKNHKEAKCETLGSHKYRRYCVNCFRNLFPDEPVSKNYRTKEQCVVDFIKKTFPNFTWRFNKTVEGGCSKRRPDIICDFGSHVIILEVDEFKHYGYLCENRRTMELMRDNGLRPMIIIRFNPDNYVDETGNKVTSCWGMDKKGICRVKPSKTEEWQLRLNKVLEEVEKASTQVPEKELTVVHLFYDADQ